MIEINFAKYDNKVFNKSIRGYDPHEVDAHISELIGLIRKLNSENESLRINLSSYSQQDVFIRSALVTAEQTSAAIKANAERDAQTIRANAELKAQEIIKAAEKDTLAYRDNVHNCYYSYERELRLILDGFYSTARKHMQAIEKDLLKSIEETIKKFDSEHKRVFVPGVSNIKTENTVTEPDVLARQWEEKEYALLLGQTLQRDITDNTGHVIAQKNTVVIPDLIEKLISRGLYGELITAVG